MKTDQETVDLHLPAGLLQQARTVWIAACQNTRTSEFHKDVARVMAGMGEKHTLEQLTEDNLFSVDIALQGEACFCTCRTWHRQCSLSFRLMCNAFLRQLRVSCCLPDIQKGFSRDLGCFAVLSCLPTVVTA